MTYRKATKLLFVIVILRLPARKKLIFVGKTTYPRSTNFPKFFKNLSRMLYIHIRIFTPECIGKMKSSFTDDRCVLANDSSAYIFSIRHF